MSCSGDQQNETGFTLIEILIATMLTAVILTVLTASFLVFFSNASYTSGRDDHAAGAEALSSWLDRDLASATIDNPPVVKPASSCAASPVMLSLSWTQYAAGSQPDAPPTKTGTAYKVEYAFTTDNLNSTRCMITRTAYSGADPAHLTKQNTLTLMHDLVGSASAGQSNLIISTTATATCASPNKAITVNLMQYHSSATNSDAAIPYIYFGCVNARTNALPTPSPT